MASPPPPSDAKSDQIEKPKAATCVFLLPREQIFRYPPPENAAKYERLSRRRNGRRFRCCRCCCFASLLIIAAAVSALAMYLVFEFRSPKFAVTKVSVRGMNLTSSAPISPEFDVIVRAENPNRNLGVYYLKGSSVSVYYDGVMLGRGALPDFYQPRKNANALRATVAGPAIVLGGAVKAKLRDARSRGEVPLVLTVEAPVKFEVGSVSTWTVTVRRRFGQVMMHID